MKYTEFINTLINNNILRCWGCNNTLQLTDITMLDLDNDKIIYTHANCGGHGGFRSFSSIKEVAESEGKDVSVFEAHRRISQDDFNLPFPIRRNRRNINRPSYTCISCSVTFDSGDQRAHNGNNYCPACYQNLFRQCSNCHQWIPRSESVSISNVNGSTRYCSNCASNFQQCPRCNNRYPPQYFQNPPNCHYCVEQIRELEMRTTFIRPDFVNRPDVRAILDDPESEV